LINLKNNMNQINKILKDNVAIIIFASLILLSIMTPEINIFGTRINLDYVIAFMSLLIIFQALKPIVESMDKNYALILLGSILVIVFVFILFFVNIWF